MGNIEDIPEIREARPTKILPQGELRLSRDLRKISESYRAGYEAEKQRQSELMTEVNKYL